ncbi:hypothetical protein MtrunA17_Chr6g0468961 [Medicago truncatula]|uniref:Transmembrane protein n=1 Tax=Medicago truncatula TaxID=3880 RepID=A0A396HI10_MEDTR|nr:hypothetical protein MtrunA17_Chr6g0468961 [Medicago truncatula]
MGPTYIWSLSPFSLLFQTVEMCSLFLISLVYFSLSSISLLPNTPLNMKICPCSPFTEASTL